MEPICDGSGREVYYRYEGRMWLLCETLFPHRHCDKCSLPILSDECITCNLERDGIRIHNPEGYIREGRDHIDIPYRIDTQL